MSEGQEISKCRSRFWNLLHHLENSQQSEKLHHFFSELHDTVKCDQYMPEFKPVREELFDKLSKDAEAPCIMKRITTRKVTEDDKDVMLKNYNNWEHWLTRCVRTTLSKHDPWTYMLRRASSCLRQLAPYNPSFRAHS